MKKFLSIALVAAMAVFCFAGCGSTGGAGGSADAAPAGSLTFTTGGDQGTYYGFGSVLAGQVSGDTATKVTAITSGGSQANVEAIQAGDAQIGFVQSDVLAYAYNGTNLFEGAAVTDISVVAALYNEQVQIVTCDPSIKTVADLKGKNVSIGAAGSGVYFNAIDVLGAYGMTESDINPTYQSFQDSADSLQNGQIDAAFIVAGAPTTAITQLSTSKQAYLVALDSEHVDSLMKTSPYYSKSVIAAGTYKGIDEDVTTVSVQAVIIADNSVSEDAIYAFTADLFENLDTLAGSNAKFGEMSLEKATSITNVPYHPGAAKYYAEKGKTVTAA